MENRYVISDEVVRLIQDAILKQENWMAYNGSRYFLEPSDINFFRNKSEAEEFCENNISDYDRFSLMHVRSVADVFLRLPYGNILTTI